MAKLTDHSDELFNRNVPSFPHAGAISHLGRDKWICKTFNIDEFFCSLHDCPVMDIEGKGGLEIWLQIRKDGLDPNLFCAKLERRNTGLILYGFQPENEPILDYDSKYCRYLKQVRRCLKCEIYAMQLIAKSMKQVKQEWKCSRCLDTMTDEMPKFGCQSCADQICRKCGQLPCMHCKDILCRDCIEQCDHCNYKRCHGCRRNDLPYDDDRWVK